MGPGQVAFCHLIEHSFKFTPFKRRLWSECVKCSINEGSSILVIDVVSEWRDVIREAHVDVHYMNSTSILTMEGLQNFLTQLNTSPEEALKRCYLRDRLDKQIGGIIIDNLSYFTHDMTSYAALLKILKQLRQSFGCWVLTISYGLEYYNGVENSTATSNRGGALTRLPASYTSEMDAVILRETAQFGRLV